MRFLDHFKTTFKLDKKLGPRKTPLWMSIGADVGGWGGVTNGDYVLYVDNVYVMTRGKCPR